MPDCTRHDSRISSILHLSLAGNPMPHIDRQGKKTNQDKKNKGNKDYCLSASVFMQSIQSMKE
jgi:hypothetical protein